LPTSFANGGPLLEVDKAKLASRGEEVNQEQEFTPKQIRAEIRKEMLFLLPPLICGLGWVLLTSKIGPIARFWASAMAHGWATGLLGSILGLLVGGFCVWITRILGSLGFGREAMGMGDVHLMVAVGAVLGPAAATIAFFVAPFFGMLLAIYMLFARKGRELPYGPYLSLATAFVMLFYCPIADYLSPGVNGLTYLLSQMFGGG
jgi:leader peptidase (prepilin peptidase)/N-methyltransferase